MNKIKLALGCALVMGAAACNQFKITETENGDRIQWHTKGEGISPKEGDIVTMGLIIKSELDSVFTNTYEMGQPIEVPLQAGMFKGSFENALMAMHEGDSATVYVSADSLFGKMAQPLPPGVPQQSDLKFIVKLISVKTQAQYQKDINDKMVGESALIEEFVGKSLKGAEKLENGIYVKTTTPGTGAAVAQGDTVSVAYVGKFFDGKVFDQNKPFTFPVGLGYVIRGWDEALRTMKVGQKATFVIPSSLAYGEKGAGGTIPPFTPLVFDIELLEIKGK